MTTIAVKDIGFCADFSRQGDWAFDLPSPWPNGWGIGSTSFTSRGWSGPRQVARREGSMRMSLLPWTAGFESTTTKSWGTSWRLGSASVRTSWLPSCVAACSGGSTR